MSCVPLYLAQFDIIFTDFELCTFVPLYLAKKVSYLADFGFCTCVPLCLRRFSTKTLVNQWYSKKFEPCTSVPLYLAQIEISFFHRIWAVYLCTSVPGQKSFIFGIFWVWYLCTSVQKFLYISEIARKFELCTSVPLYLAQIEVNWQILSCVPLYLCTWAKSLIFGRF